MMRGKCPHGERLALQGEYSGLRPQSEYCTTASFISNDYHDEYYQR